MNAPDVLAVMDDDRRVLVAIGGLSAIPTVVADHDEARAAVAELMHKAGTAADALEASADFKDRSKGRMLRAALARCGGES